jgi:heme exporter protein B
MSCFRLLLGQTVKLAYRKGGGAFGTMAFYIIAVTLLTFALGPEGMREHAGAAMCVALLLSCVTTLPFFYERDFEDGSLEQLLLLPVLLELLVLAKICGQWLANVLPILIATPVLAAMANQDYNQALHSIGMLMLVSPSLIAIGSIAAALTIDSKRGGLLQALVMMPLTIPLLIFASATQQQGAILFLAGMLFALMPLSCFVSAALIRSSQD